MVPQLPSGRRKGKVETAKMRRLPGKGYPFFPYYLVTVSGTQGYLCARMNCPRTFAFQWPGETRMLDVSWRN